MCNRGGGGPLRRGSGRWRRGTAGSRAALSTRARQPAQQNGLYARARACATVCVSVWPCVHCVRARVRRCGRACVQPSAANGRTPSGTNLPCDGGRERAAQVATEDVAVATVHSCAERNRSARATVLAQRTAAPQRRADGNAAADRRLRPTAQTAERDLSPELQRTARNNAAEAAVSAA